MGLFSKLFGGKQKIESGNEIPAKPGTLQSGLIDLQFYEHVVDHIADSKELQEELKAMLKQAFDNPRSFYNASGDFILSERGLTYPGHSHLTRKFVLVDKMISAGQMIEVDWKEQETEIRHWIIAIAKKKGYDLPLSIENKYGRDTFQVLCLINDKELEPMQYCLEILDIDSDSYVFTIVPLDKKQLVRNFFDKLK
jgi:hypothetical protein